MTLWLVIPLILLLIVIVLVLLSSIDFCFRLSRLGKDDRIELDVRALFGLIKFHYELPSLVFEGLKRGVKVKLKESGMAPVKMDADKEDQIDKETVSSWMDDVKLALKATGGLKKWLRSLLAHVKISRLDWSTDFSLGDAAYTATAAGVLWGVKWSLIGWISQNVRLQHSPRLFVAPVFRDELCFSTEAVCAGKLSVSYVLYSGILLLFRILKAEGGFARWKQLLSRKKR